MELNLYVFYGLIEAIVLLLVLCFILYYRQKKYKPFYNANTAERDLHRRYLQRMIKYTRNYAKKLNKPAAEGNKTAIKNQQHMVARLNWLVLERDFVNTQEPDEGYWEDINKKIKKMLQRWHMVEFINAPPDTTSIEHALSEDNESGSTGDPEHKQKSVVEIGTDPAKDKEIKSLKKQVRNLNNYKALYVSQQDAYKALVESYKNLKRSLSSLELEAEEADKLRDVLKQHEASEQMMNDRISETEKQKEALTAELEQLDAAFQLQQQELEAMQKQAEEAKTVAEATSISGEHSDEEELNRVQNIIDLQNNSITDLKKSVDALNLEPQKRTKLNKHLESIERNNVELQTCLQMLELERERLNSELSGLRQGDMTEITSLIEGLGDDI